MNNDELDDKKQAMRDLVEEHELDPLDQKTKKSEAPVQNIVPENPASAEAQTPQAKRVPGVPFQKGQSGNPLRRPKGARGKKTLAAERLIELNIEGVTTTGLKKALGGDAGLIKYFIALQVGRRDPAAVCIDLPPLTSHTACRDALGVITEEAAAGQITFDEADRLIGLVERRIKSLAFVEPESSDERYDAFHAYRRLVKKYPAGISAVEDERQVRLFYEDLCAVNLMPHQEKRLLDAYKEHVRLRRSRWIHVENEQANGLKAGGEQAVEPQADMLQKKEQ